MNSFKFYTLIILTLLLIVGCSTSNNDEDLPMTDINYSTTVKNVTAKKTNGKKLLITSMENKPFKIIIDDKLSGPYVDIIKMALDNIGYEYEFEITPWNRVIESVENGSIDIGFAFFDTPDRRKFAYYMQEPLGLYAMKLFAMPNSNIEFNGTLKSIEDHNIGLVQNYFYTSEISEAVANNTIKTDEATDAPTNISKLLNGRVDLIIEDSVAVNEYLKSNNIDTKLKEFEIPIIYNYTYLVFPKDEDYDDLRRELDLQFKAMKKDGSFYDIYRDYGLEYFADNFESMEEINPPMEKYFTGFKDKALSVAVIANTKPYTYRKDGELTGFIIDFLSEALDRVGTKYEFTEMPFSRTLEELESGTIDIGTDIYYSQERAEYLLYPGKPFISYPTVLFKKSTSNFEFTGDINELTSYNIGYVRDYSLGPLDEYKSNENFFDSNTNQQNFDNLINGRVDLALDIKSTGENIISDLGMSDDIISIKTPIFSEYSYIVFSRKNNLDNLLVEFEYAVNTMYKDGTLKELYEKYGLDYFNPNNK